MPILDRRIPTDFSHVQKYPASAVLRRTVAVVEKMFSLPKRYHGVYDQGAEGACVGFGQSIMMSILNRKLYDAYWLYREAQAVDEWNDTPPEQGTSLRAGFDVLRDRGHRQLWGGQARPPKVDEGIVEVNRWLQSADEARTAIASGLPVNIGINWYDSFYAPRAKKVTVNRTEYWVGADVNWGPIVGGHCITIAGASDRRQAFALLNSWGESYPWPVWLPYAAFNRLMSEQGEAAIVTDR